MRAKKQHGGLKLRSMILDINKQLTNPMKRSEFA